MWWQVLFWMLLVPCLVVLGVVYGTSKKLYKLFQILATFTYIIFVAYIIDVFDLGRDWILGLLLFSALLMLLLGHRMARRKKAKVKKPRAKEKDLSRRSLFFAGATISIMLFLIIIGSFDFGFSRHVAVERLTRGDVLGEVVTGYQPNILLATLNYTNSFFLPHIIPDKYVVLCWYNSSTEEIGPQIVVSVDGKEWFENGDALEEVAPGKSVTRRIRLGGGLKDPLPPEDLERFNLTANVRGKLVRYAPYDALLLVAGPERLDCLDMKLEKLTLYQVIPLS